MEKFCFQTPPVCVFDSGIGGLNLLSECVRKFPNLNFAYFADNYNVPYGNLPYDKLCGFVDGIFKKIETFNPLAVVVACNTVTAKCINFLRDKYPFEIVGIQPAVKPAAATGKNCLVLATPLTAQSQSLKKLVALYGAGKTEIAECPKLAEYIENNIFDISESEILRLLPEKESECVILGCTHYIFAKNIIKNRYKCAIFDGIEGTCNHLGKILGKYDHFNGGKGEIAFFGGNEGKNRLVFEKILMSERL